MFYTLLMCKLSNVSKSWKCWCKNIDKYDVWSSKLRELDESCWVTCIFLFYLSSLHLVVIIYLKWLLWQTADCGVLWPKELLVELIKRKYFLLHYDANTMIRVFQGIPLPQRASERLEWRVRGGWAGWKNTRPQCCSMTRLKIVNETQNCERVFLKRNQMFKLYKQLFALVLNTP